MVMDTEEIEMNEEEGGSSSDKDEEQIQIPYLGMEFQTEDAAKAYYDAYATHIGFTTCARSTHTHTAREFLCSTFKRKSPDTCCNALMKIEFTDSHKWLVTKFVKDHNHSIPTPIPTPTPTPTRVHYLRPRRHFAKTATDNYAASRSSRKRTLGRDAQNLLDYFKRMQAENPGFFYAIQLDDDNHITNVFWADARSRTAYAHFGDAVTFDTMYRPNQYRVPFAPFTGVNHHGQPLLFGCALLYDESESSFLWLFKTWLEAMSARPPLSITTDQDRAVQAAITHVFPLTRHRICKWHILREGQERLGHVCLTHPTFQGELYNCINLTETIHEFESGWNSLVAKYELRNNEWLQALYTARQHWAPVYFRDTFFAAISTNQGYETVSSFFDGYVNQHTTLPLFFRQYERAIENWFEKEIEADFETICTTPVLKTPSPMEKQAANMYTRKIFAKFQDELVETFVYTANKIEGDGAMSTFRVAKFEDDDNAYVVTLNIPEMRASCSCRMFEYSGILCRHVLTVFTVTNVLTLPAHYILKRWTRNAKSAGVLEERQNEIHVQESMTVRYNNLCREAIRYADEGALAVETYNVAMNSLREGAKKISMVKRNVARVAPPSSRSHGTGSNQEDGSRKTPLSVADMTPLLWPRQDEVTRRFNLNDAGIPSPPVADLNLPRMAPVSLHRDNVLPDNMVVLPSLKSMTWVMENKNSPVNRMATINLKLQDYSKSPSGESEVKFKLSKVTLEPMLKSMGYIGDQLSSPASRVAVISLKLQDTESTLGEAEVKFQVSRDTLGAMLRSMNYIREQLSDTGEPQLDPSSKKLRR